MRNLALLLSLCTLVTVCPAAEPEPSHIPGRGFEDIHLGMSLDDFVSARKAAKHSPSYDARDEDPATPNQLRMEKLEGHPFFEGALYLFEGGKLVGVGLMSEKIPTDILKGKSEALLFDLLSIYGKPSSLAIVNFVPSRDGKGYVKRPVLYWAGPEVLIGASSPTWGGRNDSPEKGRLQLKIFSPSVPALQVPFPDLADVTEREEESIVRSVELMVERLMEKLERSKEQSQE